MAEPMILVINPGSTSTKVAVFVGEKCAAASSIEHAWQTKVGRQLANDELAVRRDCVLSWLQETGHDLKTLTAIAARGGRFRPVASGTYLVNDMMMADARASRLGEHPSSLGCLIAHDLAERAGIDAFVVDPVSVDELVDVARLTGLPAVPRISLSHALNMKAVARQAAVDERLEYEQGAIIVAHLGGGSSISAHRHGRMIDILNSDVEGPFSAERAGSLPSFGLIQLCFQPEASETAVWKRCSGNGGLVAHLGTKDAREIESRIQGGDVHAELVFRGMAYAIAKGIGAMAGAIGCRPDVIAITGGLARSTLLMGWVSARVSFLAPVRIYPGEFEMEALARGVLRVLGGESPRVYA